MNDTEYRSLVERDIAHLIHPQFTSARPAQRASSSSRAKAPSSPTCAASEYIDGLSSLWNVAVGHGRSELAEAAAKQMSELAFANGYTGYSNVPGDRARREALPPQLPATWTPSSSPTAAPRPTRSPSSWRASTGSSRARWRR